MFLFIRHEATACQFSDAYGCNPSTRSLREALRPSGVEARHTVTMSPLSVLRLTTSQNAPAPSRHDESAKRHLQVSRVHSLDFLCRGPGVLGGGFRDKRSPVETFSKRELGTNGREARRKNTFFMNIMCGRVSSNTTNTADPSPSAGGWNPMPGHGTVGLSRLSSLSASTHWRSVRQQLRPMSTARNALAHLPVVNPKARAHRLVDTLAPCSPWCSTGSTRYSRPSRARSSCVKEKCSFTAKGIRNSVCLHQALFQLVQKIRCGAIRLYVPVDHEVVKVQRAMTCGRCTDDAFDAAQDPILQGLPPIGEG